MKTNRQKCIDMWQWIVDHSDNVCRGEIGLDVKQRWKFGNQRMAKEIADYGTCFACLDCLSNCERCPVNWGDFDCWCGTSYQDWFQSPTKQNAEAVLKVIKDTWKEITC